MGQGYSKETMVKQTKKDGNQCFGVHAKDGAGHNNPFSNKHVHSRCVQTGMHSWNFPCIHKKKGSTSIQKQFSSLCKICYFNQKQQLKFKKKVSLWLVRDLMYIEEITERTQNLLGGRTAFRVIFQNQNQPRACSISIYFPGLSCSCSCYQCKHLVQVHGTAQNMILQQLGLWNIPQKSSKILAQNGGSCEMFKPPEKSSTQQNASSNRDRREPVPGKTPHARNPS